MKGILNRILVSLVITIINKNHELKSGRDGKTNRKPKRFKLSQSELEKNHILSKKHKKYF